MQTTLTMSSKLRTLDEKTIMFNHLVNKYVEEDLCTKNHEQRHVVRCAVDKIFKLHYIRNCPKNREWSRKETLSILENMEQTLKQMQAKKPLQSFNDFKNTHKQKSFDFCFLYPIEFLAYFN